MKSMKNMWKKKFKKDINQNEKWLNENFENLSNDIKNEFLNRIQNKGWYVYHRILKYLENKNYRFEDDKEKYELVSGIHIYDKRIRQLLYKFTSFIEEYYGSKIYNGIDDIDVACEFENNKNNTCFGGKIEFLKEKELINEKKYEWLKKVKELRNKICHNYLILITNDDYKRNEEIYQSINSLYLLLDSLDSKEIKEDFLECLKNEWEQPLNNKKYNNTYLLDFKKIITTNDKISELNVYTYIKK